MVTAPVPLPAAPVAFSAPPASVTVTVKLSPVVLPTSATLTPARAVACPASPCAEAGAVSVGRPLAVTATWALAVLLAASVTVSFSVSVAPAGVKVSVSSARSAFTCASVPVMFTAWAPAFTAPAPWAVSVPTLSVTATLKMAPAAAPASVTAMPGKVVATLSSVCTEAGAVIPGRPSTFSVVLPEVMPPRLSFTPKLTVSAPPAAGVSFSVARSAFTVASEPVITSEEVPLPLIEPAAPVAVSAPPASPTVTVKVSPALALLLASATLTVAMAVATPCAPDSEAGMPLSTGAPFTFSVVVPEAAPPRLSVA